MFLQSVLYVFGTMVFFHREIKRKRLPYAETSLVPKNIFPSWKIWMHLPSFSCFTTKIYTNVHPAVEKFFHSHMDNIMSHRSHIWFANIYELNIYFEVSDGGLFVMQKINSFNKELDICRLFFVKIEQRQ